LGESREFGELAGEQGRFGLCGVLDVADVVPRLEGGVRSARYSVAGMRWRGRRKRLLIWSWADRKR
jgi:hypothetical protein